MKQKEIDAVPTIVVFVASVTEAKAEYTRIKQCYPNWLRWENHCTRRLIFCCGPLSHQNWRAINVRVYRPGEREYRDRQVAHMLAEGRAFNADQIGVTYGLDGIFLKWLSTEKLLHQLKEYKQCGKRFGA